jgi:hypothetical protein
MAQNTGLSTLHEQILKLLRLHPEGLDIYQIRSNFPDDPGIQQHLDRRVRSYGNTITSPLRKADGMC